MRDFRLGKYVMCILVHGHKWISHGRLFEWSDIIPTVDAFECERCGLKKTRKAKS